MYLRYAHCHYWLILYIYTPANKRMIFILIMTHVFPLAAKGRTIAMALWIPENRAISTSRCICISMV